MVHRDIPFFVVCFAVASAATGETTAANFQPQCEKSYRHTAAQDLDSESCPMKGDGATGAYPARNTAKTNLCATGRRIGWGCMLGRPSQHVQPIALSDSSEQYALWVLSAQGAMGKPTGARVHHAFTGTLLTPAVVTTRAGLQTERQHPFRFLSKGGDHAVRSDQRPL